jgi:hypothetical protein
MRALLLLALVRLGETERAEQVVDGLGDRDRDLGEIRVATAVLRLAQGDPDAATVALAPGPAGHRARRPDRPDPRPAGWQHARAAGRVAAA